MENIIESNYFSFEEYKRLVEKYEKEDWREINFQNRIVLLVLEKVFINEDTIAIVDVSTQYKNRESLIHTRQPYAKESTPDLLVVKNWNYKNITKPKQDYLAVVEIKSPKLDPIVSNSHHTTEEVRNYLANGSKVILTDCYKWIFYDLENEPKSFTLRDADGWKMMEVENPDFLVKEFGFEKSRLESEVWKKLIAYIEQFCKPPVL